MSIDDFPNISDVIHDEDSIHMFQLFINELSDAIAANMNSCNVNKHVVNVDKYSEFYDDLTQQVESRFNQITVIFIPDKDKDGLNHIKRITLKWIPQIFKIEASLYIEIDKTSNKNGKMAPDSTLASCVFDVSGKRHLAIRSKMLNIYRTVKVYEEKRKIEEHHKSLRKAMVCAFPSLIDKLLLSDEEDI